MYENRCGSVEEPGDIEVTSLSLDDPRDDEVLVDIVAAGVCHSDYDQYVGGTDGPCPMVLGHEGAGIVEATGDDVTGVEPGDHVVLAVMPFCGMCRH